MYSRLLPRKTITNGIECRLWWLGENRILPILFFAPLLLLALPPSQHRLTAMHLPSRPFTLCPSLRFPRKQEAPVQTAESVARAQIRPCRDFASAAAEEVETRRAPTGVFQPQQASGFDGSCKGICGLGGVCWTRDGICWWSRCASMGGLGWVVYI